MLALTWSTPAGDVVRETAALTDRPFGGNLILNSDHHPPGGPSGSRLSRLLSRRWQSLSVRFSTATPSEMAEFPAPEHGIVLTHFIVSADVERSRRFYTDVLGGETVRTGEPTYVALANSWIIINLGGGPTDDKPEVTLETPPDPERTSSFLNIRVADIHALYAEWTARGAEFLTAPIPRETEIRCYLRDPDGHLIEVGQTTRHP